MLEEIVFLLIVQIPHSVRVLDQVVVRIGRVIFGDALEAIKQIAGTDFHEAVDAYIPYVGFIAVQSVPDVAMFLDVLPTGAVIVLFADLDADQIPLEARGIKPICDGKRQNMCLQSLEVMGGHRAAFLTLLQYHRDGSETI